MMTILRARIEHIEELVLLFNAYRIFYNQDSDVAGARSFLSDRINKEDAHIFVAVENNALIGFTQLYATFSSVSMEPVFILNDLYVTNAYRKKGVGEALLNYAKTFCRENGYKGLALETATDNPAQKLYERLGWEKDSQCFHYFWKAH